MAVILFLLKVIGGILLAVLLFLVLLAALVLSAPVSYEFYGKAEEHFSLGGKVSWLFRILSVRFSYEGKNLTSEIRIFGIRKKTKTQTEDVLSEEEGADVSGVPQKIKRQASEDKNIAPEPGRVKTGADENRAGSGNGTKTGAREEAKGQKGKKIRPSKNGGDEKKSGKKETISERVLNIQNRIKQIPQKIHSIQNQILDETAKTAYGLMWSELLFLFRHFRFRKIQTDLTFSLSDPAWTGAALGILATLPFLYRYDVNVYPDFASDTWYARGTFCAKGHAHLLHLLVSAFRLWRKKELRVFVKRLLK